MRCVSSIFALMGLSHRADAVFTWNFGAFGPDSRLWLFNNEFFANDPSVTVSLYPQSIPEPGLGDLVTLDCQHEHQTTFENSNEYLPEFMPGYKYLECTFNYDTFEHDQTYCLAIYDHQQSYYNNVCMTFNEYQPAMGRYEDTYDLALRVAKAPSASSRFRRSSDGAPSIEGITPRTGSPLGNTYVTIYGQNLASKKIDLAGSQSESESEGEDYVVWFEREHEGDFWKIPCLVDRMLTLHAEPLDGKDFVICEAQAVPRFYRHYLRMTIDGGEVLKGGHFDFYESHAASAEFFYPAASAPAVASGQYDYEGEFFTRWFDTDNNDDGVEDESFMRHWQEDRAAFQNCQNPIGIEVYNTDNVRAYENSYNENADGKPAADYIDPIQATVAIFIIVLTKLSFSVTIDE